MCRELEIDRGMLHRWKTALGEDGVLAFPGKGNLKPRDRELWEMRRELEKVKRERDILKKALAYFASRQE
ncbi:MAG: transposase [Acidobacteriota bacterium]